MQRVALSAGNVYSLRLNLAIINAERCPINFATRSSDIALHIDIRLRSQTAVLNSYVGGVWGGQITVSLAGVTAGEPFWISLRFSYRTVELRLPGLDRVLFTMPVNAGEICELKCAASLREAELREGFATLPAMADTSGSSLRSGPGGTGPVGARLTTAAIDCDEATAASLAEFCDEVIEIDTRTLNGGLTADRTAGARQLADRLNGLSNAAAGNFLAVSRGAGTPDDLRALAFDLDLRFRKDPFLLALGASFALGDPWVLALPGGSERSFVPFLDAVSPTTRCAWSSVFLHAEGPEPVLPINRPYRPPAKSTNTTIVRYEAGRLAVVRCSPGGPPGSEIRQSPETDALRSYTYTLKHAPRSRTGVEGDCIVVPDLPVYRLLPNALEAASTALFRTTDYDAVLFLHADDIAAPPGLYGGTFDRCAWAHLAPDGLPVATFVARRRSREDDVLSAKNGAAPVMPAGAGYWDTDKIEDGSAPILGTLLKELRSPEAPPPAPAGDDDAQAPLPAICLSAIGRLCAQPAGAVSAEDIRTAMDRLAHADLHRFDWKRSVERAVDLGHLIDVHQRTPLLERLMGTTGIPLDHVCERAGQRSLDEREWDDALRWYERWYEQPERPLAAGLGMVWTHLISGSTETAFTVLQKVSERSGAEESSRPVLEARFQVHEYAGQWDRAMEAAERILAAGPVKPHLLARFASCALHAKRYETAAGLLSQLRRSDRNAADLLYLEARLLQLQGRLAESGRLIDEFIAVQPEYAPLNAAPTVFRRLDTRLLSADADSVSCIIVARNEGLRLPWLIDYYRRLGAGTIIVIDNGSTDGSVEYLLQRGDVQVFHTVESYAGSRYGVKWHNEIADEHLRDRWVLVADADEALVYPGAETVSLPQLCRYLDAQGSEGLRTIMLDMYPEVPLRELRYEPGQPLIDACPWFDAGPYIRWQSPRAPYWAVSGGVRERFFWRRRHAMQSRPPVIQKIPLVKWRTGMKFLSSTHEVSPLQVADISGAVLHFKFLQDFHRKALIEVHRKEHYNGASEYMAYLDAMNADPGATLRYPGSQRYSGPADLVRRGLMDTSEPYQRFCSEGPAE
jgi:tetratricopeptide (TPR) repeat protein